MQLPETEMFDLPGGPARVVWRRNARARRVTLRIDPCGGDVVVTLPPRAGRGAGMALLMDHAAWVADRLAALPRVASVWPGPETSGNAEGAPASVSAGQGPFSDLYPRPDSNRRYRRERAAC